MAHVRWQQRAAPDSNAVMNGILAGATGALQAQRDNEARDFQYGEQRRQEGRAERMGLDKERRHLEDQKSLAQFNDALKRESETAGAGYRKQARTMEVDQLKKSMGAGWSPDHDMAAEIYRLTGDHGALKQIFTPQDPMKMQGQQLLNQGRDLSNQYTQLRMNTLQDKNAREATLPADLERNVRTGVDTDMEEATNDLFDGRITQDQFEEIQRASQRNLHSGLSEAAAGKPYAFTRPQIVRTHTADPATAARLQTAEARREEQNAVNDLRSHAKDLERQLIAIDKNLDPKYKTADEDPRYQALAEELAQVRGELGRRARKYLTEPSGPPAPSKPAGTAPGTPPGTLSKNQQDAQALVDNVTW